MLNDASKVYENVVNEYKDELIQIRMENPIHHAHEGCLGISKIKWQDYKLIVVIASSKSSLEDIFIFNLNLVTSRS